MKVSLTVFLIIALCMASVNESCLDRSVKHGWVRYRINRAGVPEGLKQQPIRTEQNTFSVPYHLAGLWDHIARGRKAWLFIDIMLTILIHHLLNNAHGL